MSDRALATFGGASAALAVTSALCFGYAMGFDPGAGAEMVERLGMISPGDAALIRWAAVADMLGYYLLPAVLVIFLRDRLAWTSPVWRDLASVAGVIYATVGAAGAALLAAAGPPLIEDGSEQALARLETLGYAVQGLWQWLEPVPFGVWMAGTALALRARLPRYAALFVVLSLGAALVWAGRVLGVEPVLVAGLVLWLAPFPFALATVARWGNP